jgi:plastocyanin
MKILLRALLVLIAFTSISCGAKTESTQTPGANDVTIHILGMAGASSYTTGVQVTLGGRVFFVADIAGHSATSDTAVFDTGVLASGATYVWTPTGAGTFPFHCSVHGTMTGSVTVVP